MRRTTGTRQGPRSHRVIQAVLTATVRELELGGYGGLTIDGVAREAGVHRSSIYRRWPTKVDLVAALLEHQFDQMEAPEAPDLPSELRALLSRLARNLSTPEGQTLARIMAAGEPELEALAGESRDRAVERFRAAFVRAAARGELGPDADVDMRVHLTFFGAIHWLLIHGGDAPEGDLDRLLSVILAGVRPPTQPPTLI